MSDSRSRPGLLDIILSVLASAFGVQSERNRKRDFAQTSVVTYVIVGIVFVVLFIVLLMTIVNLIVN